MTTLTLFEPPKTCPCGAVQTPGQDTVPTCRYDLQQHLEPWQRDHPNRPRACLNTHDPATAEVPY